MTDLVPTRRRVLTLWYAAGAALIGLIEFLHARLDWFSEQLPRCRGCSIWPSGAAWPPGARRPGFRSRRGWFRFCSIHSAGTASTIIAPGIESGFGRRWPGWPWRSIKPLPGMSWFASWPTRRRPHRPGTSLAVAGGLLGTGAGGRGAADDRDARLLLSLTLFWLGGLAWAAALAGPQLLAGPADSTARTMLFAGLALIGQWTILSAHVAYARHVLFDAHGLIAPRAEPRRPRLGRRKPKRTPEQPESEPATSERRPAAVAASKAPAPTASKPAATSPLVTAAKPAASTPPPAAGRLGVVAQKSDDEEDDDSLPNLSRAERKRSEARAASQFRDAASSHAGPSLAVVHRPASLLYLLRAHWQPEPAGETSR